MPRLLVRPEEADEESSEPMAQILWLHRGRLVDAPPPSPVPLLRTPPPGWYGDRLRFFDGQAWADEVRPIRRPSSLMRVAYEEAPSAESETGPGTPSPPPAPTEVGLLGLPPPLASEPATQAHPVDAAAPVPTEVGLIALPPALSPPATRQVPFRSDLRLGLVAGLKTSRFVLLWAVAAVALVVVVGFLSST